MGALSRKGSGHDGKHPRFRGRACTKRSALPQAAFMSRRAPFLLRAGFKQQYKKLPDSAMGLCKGPDAEVVQIPWVKELFVPTTGVLFANPTGSSRRSGSSASRGYHTQGGPRLRLNW